MQNSTVKSQDDGQFQATHPLVSDENRLLLVEYWRIVMRSKWAILGFALVVGMLALAISMAITPEYRATSTLMMEEGKTSVVKIEDVIAVTKNREYFNTQLEVIKSREVAVRTIKRLKLWDQSEFDPRKPKSAYGLEKLGLDQLGQEQRTLLEDLGILQPIRAQWSEDDLVQAVFKRFSSQLSVTPGRSNLIVSVSFTSKDPVLAAKVANMVADQYIFADHDGKANSSQQANMWLQDRLQGLRDSLMSSERKLQGYRERSGVVEMGGSVQQFAGQQITEVSKSLIDAKVRRAEFESTYEQIKGLKDGDYSSIPLVMRNPQVAEAKTREATAKAAVSQFAGRYGAEHPRMVAAQAELSTATEYLRRQSELAVSSITREYEAASATVKALDQALTAAKGALQGVNRLGSEQLVLEREVATNKQLYELFLSRAKETTTTGQDIQTAPVARVIDPAINGAKVSPKIGQIAVSALIFGLLLGVAIVLLRENLDNTLKTTEAVEQKLKQALLTTLPLMSNKERTSSVRFYSDKQDSLFAEAVRTARTGILLSSLDDACKVIMVTSSIPGEGKTTVATNLAMAMALDPAQRALLIDADMRRPQVARSFELPPGSPGLSNLVAGTAEFARCMHTVERSHLTILPAGDIPPNPLELILSKRFKQVLASLKTRFDIIIIDSPPVELVSDALVLSPLASSTLFVVRANSTPVPLARRAITRLQRGGGHMLGVVLNQLDFKDASRYYGEQSGYSHYAYDGYGYKQASAEGGFGAKLGKIKAKLQFKTAESAPKKPSRAAVKQPIEA